MVVDKSKRECEEKAEEEEEGEVNLEAELISALGELRIVRKKNKLLKE